MSGRDILFFGFRGQELSSFAHLPIISQEKKMAHIGVNIAHTFLHTVSKQKEKLAWVSP
jgi:hypothetical protein